LGLSAFENFSNNVVIKDEDALVYLLNYKGIVQVRDILFKQLNCNESQTNWNFFLTMPKINYNSENYINFEQGILNQQKMNKMANREPIDNWLFDFLNENPTGHIALEPVPLPQGRIKLFGWFTSGSNGPCQANGNPQYAGKTCCFATRKKYFLGILVKSEEDGQRTTTCEEAGVELQ
jgi:hypothetical protein